MANDNYTFAQVFVKSVLLTTLFLFLFGILTMVSIGVFAFRQLLTFTSTAQTTPPALMSTINEGWNATPQHTNNHKNILILGVDTLTTRGDSPPLTDTMMLVSLDLSNGKLTTLSLPRDLWHDDYATKINALYSYGQERYPDRPERFPTEALSELTGVPIHHTIVVSLDQVATIIDLVGGIEVEIPESFVDTEFPRPDVDVTVERDPAKLYQTVSFTQGKELMSGERALQFIRSRHAEGDEGSDVARSQRQQLVINALVGAILRPEVLFNPQKLGELYLFYTTYFAQSVSVAEGIATAKTLVPVRNGVTLTSQSLTIYPEDSNGVVYHPPLSRTHQNQWVYVIRDSDAFTHEVQSKLGIK